MLISISNSVLMEGYHNLNFQNSDYNYNNILNNNAAPSMIPTIRINNELNEKLNLDVSKNMSLTTFSIKSFLRFSFQMGS